jgi:hypothetical protein
MTTPRDLLMVALDAAPGRSLEPGDLSLALAGAEVIDLLDDRVIILDGERIVPAHRPTTDDRLLNEAAASLVRQEPYESISDLLWRRGRGLFPSYLAVLESEGQVARQRGRRVRSGNPLPVDSPAHRAATERWDSDDAVLTALGATVGMHGERTADPPYVDDNAVATVLAAVDAAVMELGLERQRRDIEDAAFDNIWRGGWMV